MNIEAVIIAISIVPSDRSTVSQSRIRDDHSSSLLQLHVYSGEENVGHVGSYEL